MNARYFEIARKAAMKSTFMKSRVGVCLVVRGSIYTGFNRGTKTHTKSPHDFRSIHAEFDAIRRAGLKNPELRYGEMYIYRLKKDNSQGMAKPCYFCSALLKHCGIKKFYYTGDDGLYSYNAKQV